MRALVTDYLKAGIGAYTLEYCLALSGFYNSEEAVKEEARWCTKEELDEIKGKWIKTVTHNATRDGVFSLNTSGKIFSLLTRVDVHISTEITKSLLKDDADVDTLVRTIGEQGSCDSIKGRFSHVTDEILDSIGVKEEIRTRVRKRLESNVKAPIELQAMYNSIVSGKKFYLVDCSEGKPF